MQPITDTEHSVIEKLRTSRWPGESHARWKQRKETERLIGVAQRHLAAAEAIMAKIRAQL